jgi:hypothetical protein
MKKVIYPAVFLLISVLTSCQNENSVNPRPTDDIISRVVVSGRVRAELNTTNAILENVPDGLKVVAEISTRDLVLNPGSGNYPSKYYETTITNGQYSIEVEAGPYGSDVTVYFPEFRADVQTASTPQSTVFSSTTRSVYVVKGVNQIIDINY